MAASGSKLNRIGRQTKRNISAQVREVMSYVRSTTRKYIEDVMERVGQLFVEEAQNRLIKNGYNTARYAKYITWDSENKRVVVKSPRSQEPDIMWYLEYGTGVRGMNEPHPDANRVGWGYALNIGTVGQKGSGWRKNPAHPDGIGWWFRARNRNIYRAEDDIIKRGDSVKTGTRIFTSGITPVRYLYDTIQDLPRIVERAKRQLRTERNAQSTT